MNKKKKILCIIGRSGSGKTTIENWLTFQRSNTYNRLVSYTTRPMREGETDGKEHHFVSSADVPHDNSILAYTRYGDYEYWADAKDLCSGKINIYVIDVEGYRYLKHFSGEQYDIRVLYVKRDVRDGIDLQRMQRDTGRMTLNPDEIDCVLRNNGNLHELESYLIWLERYIYAIFLN